MTCKLSDHLPVYQGKQVWGCAYCDCVVRFVPADEVEEMPDPPQAENTEPCDIAWGMAEYYEWSEGIGGTLRNDTSD